MSRRVAVFMPERAELSSVAAVTDLLQLANRFATERTGARTGGATRNGNASIACRWLSLDGAAVTLAAGGSLAADGEIPAEATHGEIYDAIFIAGFENPADDRRLKTRLAASHRLSAWLRHQHRHGALIAAAGNGVFLLAESGLLDGRDAAPPWWQQPLFHRLYPAVRLVANRQISECERLICAGSLAAQLPMALSLVQRLTSPNTADWLAKTTLIDPRGELKPPPTMSVDGSAGGDGLVAAAQYQLQQSYAKKAQLGDLATQLAISPRTLNRRFQRALGVSPQDYVQSLRIESAKHMLLRTRLRVDHVGQQVGYSDPGFFKRVFRSQTGMTPTAWRALAQGKPSAQSA